MMKCSLASWPHSDLAHSERVRLQRWLDSIYTEHILQLLEELLGTSQISAGSGLPFTVVLSPSQHFQTGPVRT